WTAMFACVCICGIGKVGRRELHLQTILRILAVFQPPARNTSRSGISEIASQVFQVLVAKEYLGPLAIVLLQHCRPRHENRRRGVSIVLRRALRETIRDQDLLAAIER